MYGLMFPFGAALGGPVLAIAIFQALSARSQRQHVRCLITLLLAFVLLGGITPARVHGIRIDQDFVAWIT